MQIPNIDDPCGKYFTYRYFIECSETWHRTHVDNLPKQYATFSAIKHLAESILDPVSTQFQQVVLTYAFSSPALVNRIKKNKFPNIHPPGDQHSGCEVNSKGEPICDRLGFAVDIYVPGHSAHEVACWIIENTPFDRLYFYSKHRPFHVSAGPENNQMNVYMKGFLGGRHQPHVMTRDKFKKLIE